MCDILVCEWCIGEAGGKVLVGWFVVGALDPCQHLTPDTDL